MGANIAVTDNNFQQEVLNSDVPVLVDFWATWCGPCKMIAPAVEELAGEYAGKAKVLKMDVDSNPDTPSEYGVMSIPALLLFKGGKVVDTIVGAQPKQNIAAMIDRAL
jgi:thioredoxin 1